MEKVTINKEKFWRELQKIEDEPEEEVFLSKVASSFAMKFYRKDGTPYPPVDMKVVESVGVSKLKQKLCIPLTTGEIFTADPFIDILAGYRAGIVLTTRDVISEIISSLEEIRDTNDIGKIVDTLIERAVNTSASDIHINYNSIDMTTEIIFRIDGFLNLIESIPNSGDFHSRLINKIYQMTQKINQSEYHELHDASFMTEVLKRRVNVRVSSVPVFSSDNSITANIAMRLLYAKANSIIPLESLGYTSDTIEILKKLISLPYGIIFIAGPTGSGKTTTFYSLLDIKNKRRDSLILTIEDPVEIRLPGIVQVEYNEERGVTFSAAIRSFLRHDPDVILIGEVRDRETAAESLRAAITGHLVLATIHANTAAGVFSRLIDLGIPKDILLNVTKASIAQRLVRKLCVHCKEYVCEEEKCAEALGMEIETYRYHYGGLFPSGFWFPRGCDKCGGVGYIGRTALGEILSITPDVKNILKETNFVDDTAPFERSIRQQTYTMKETAKHLISEGITSIQEVERFVPISSSVSYLTLKL
ncbi:MAG: GspE/PulE family protein [Nitrospirota bacterium]